MRKSMQKMAVMAVGAVFLAGAVSADNRSRFDAYPLAGGQFEVVADFTESAIYWCGAGIYSQNSLSKSTTQRVYVISGVTASSARPGERAVVFGFAPPPGVGQVQTFSRDVSIIGNSMSVSQAVDTCSERSSSG